MIKTLELNAGVLGSDPSAYATGWYRDPSTGKYYYYNAVTGIWYFYAAGLLYAMGDVPTGLTAQTPWKGKIEIARGDTLRVSYYYKYQGPAQATVTEIVVVCIYGAFGGTTKIKKTKDRSLAEELTPRVYTGTQDLVIPTDAQTDWDDIVFWVEIGGSSKGGVLMEQALTIIVPVTIPTFTLFEIKDYVKV